MRRISCGAGTRPGIGCFTSTMAKGGDRSEIDMAMQHRFTLKRNKTEGGWELKDQTGGR